MKQRLRLYLAVMALLLLVIHSFSKDKMLLLPKALRERSRPPQVAAAQAGDASGQVARAGASPGAT